MPTTQPPADAALAGADTAAPGAGAPAEAAPAFSPLYQQIKSLILRSLQAGEWKPGDMIPSEFDLASRYKVSQGTVRKAIDELATENLRLREIAFNQGLSTSIDRVDAELKLSAVKTQQLGASYRYVQAYARLMAISGQLDEFIGRSATGTQSQETINAR